MNNPGFENYIDALKVMENYGIRNNTNLSTPPKETSSRPIKNNTPGVEAWALDRIKESEILDFQESSKHYSSDFALFDGDNFDTDFNNTSISENTYSLKNIYIKNIEIKLIEKEPSESKPPNGRSQKAHKAIQALNHKRKYK